MFSLRSPVRSNIIWFQAQGCYRRARIYYTFLCIITKLVNITNIIILKRLKNRHFRITDFMTCKEATSHGLTYAIGLFLKTTFLPKLSEVSMLAKATPHITNTNNQLAWTLKTYLYFIITNHYFIQFSCIILDFCSHSLII